jgi:hypothetical protein
MGIRRSEYRKSPVFASSRAPAIAYLVMGSKSPQRDAWLWVDRSLKVWGMKQHLSGPLSKDSKADLKDREMLDLDGLF